MVRPYKSLEFATVLTASRFPEFLKHMVTDVLNLVWTVRQPGLQQATSAEILTTRVIKLFEGRNMADYMFVDFCSGSGGPTPMIAEQVNRGLEKSAQHIRFVLTDIKPNIRVWQNLTAKSDNISYIELPINATDPSNQKLSTIAHGSRVFRTFHGCFHHFEDREAKAILRASIQRSEGFG